MTQLNKMYILLVDKNSIPNRVFTKAKAKLKILDLIYTHHKTRNRSIPRRIQTT